VITDALLGHVSRLGTNSSLLRRSRTSLGILKEHRKLKIITQGKFVSMMLCWEGQNLSLEAFRPYHSTTTPTTALIISFFGKKVIFWV
jgi:hypothetical protein